MTAASESSEELAEAQAPKLVTDIQVRSALALIERDDRVTTRRSRARIPSCRACGGLRDRGRRRQPVPRLNAGIAVTSTGHCHPHGGGGDPGQAAQLIHYSASDFFLPIYTRGLRAPRPHRADVGGPCGASSRTPEPRRWRPRSSSPLRDRTPVHRRVLQLRSTAGRTGASPRPASKSLYRAELRADAARGVHAPYATDATSGPRLRAGRG
jgi:4-aminobutyrate aminotransferase